MQGVYSEANGTFTTDKVYRGERIRRRGFKGVREAESFLVEEMERVRLASTGGQRGRFTFEQAAAHYLRAMRGKKKSVESDYFHLKPVLPFIGQLPLDRIHNKSLEPFIKARKAEGRKDKTVNLSLAMVRRILNLAARDWRDDNDMTWLAVPPMITLLQVRDARPPRPIMWEEQKRLIPALPRHLAGMAQFILLTGVRDDVVCSLQWSWEVPVPQLGTSIFVVPEQHVKGEERYKQDKVLVCSSKAMEIIERQRGLHETHVFVYRRERVKNKHLEPTMAYAPIDGMSNTAWNTARELAQVGDLHVHDLRHTVGMRLREAGVASEIISDILWHSKKTMTDHYSMGQIREILTALELLKDESKQWNMSLQSLIQQAGARKTAAASKSKVTQESPR